MLKYLILLFIVLNKVAAQEKIYPKHCQGKLEKISVCFLDPNLGRNVNRKAGSLNPKCKPPVKSFYVKDHWEIQDILDGFIRDCKQIKKLRFLGHAIAGYHAAGALDLQSLQKNLSPYHRVVEPGSRIKITGCHSGRGCLGRVFMLEMAKALLPNGGIVTAPDYYVVTPILGLIPHFSFTGKSTVLNYSPKKKVKEKWSYVGLHLFRNKGLVHYCQKEIKKKLKKYNKEEKKAEERGCNFDYIYGLDRVITAKSELLRFSELLGKRNKLNNKELNEISRLYTLVMKNYELIDYQTKEYKSCDF